MAKRGLFVAVLAICYGAGYVVADLSLFYQGLLGLIVVIVGTISLVSLRGEGGQSVGD
jgi:hypothetical protein